jgi:hypothetical protein
MIEKAKQHGEKRDSSESLEGASSPKRNRCDPEMNAPTTDCLVLAVPSGVNPLGDALASLNGELEATKEKYAKIQERISELAAKQKKVASSIPASQKKWKDLEKIANVHVKKIYESEKANHAKLLEERASIGGTLEALKGKATEMKSKVAALEKDRQALSSQISRAEARSTEEAKYQDDEGVSACASLGTENDAKAKKVKSVFDIIDRDGSGFISRLDVIKSLASSSEVRDFFDLPEVIREGESHDKFEAVFQKIAASDQKFFGWEEFAAYAGI